MSKETFADGEDRSSGVVLLACHLTAMTSPSSVFRLMLGMLAFAFPFIGNALTPPSGPDSIAGNLLTIYLPHDRRDIVLVSNGSCYETEHWNMLMELPYPVPLSIGRYTYASGYSRTGALKITMKDPGPLTIEGTLDFGSGQWATNSEEIGTVRFILTPLAQVALGKLSNISARSLVNASTRCIAGFIVTGQTPRLVLIRAVGPTMAQYGVPAAVPDPRLEVYNRQNLIAANDNWSNSTSTAAEISAAAIQASAFPLAAGSKDAAVLMILPPGLYSVMGKSDLPGEILLEVYLVE